MDEIRKAQAEVCSRFGAPFVESHGNLKLGLGKNFDPSRYPIHGLRHPPEGDTTGWYIWTGECSDAPDFFEPHHTYHMHAQSPDIVKYLGLAPGWRFLVARNYEDVWYDEDLLNI
jgi:hypothetical protein